MKGKGTCQHIECVHMKLSVHLSVSSCVFMVWYRGKRMWTDFCDLTSVCLCVCEWVSTCLWISLSPCMCAFPLHGILSSLCRPRGLSNPEGTLSPLWAHPKQFSTNTQGSLLTFLFLGLWVQQKPHGNLLSFFVLSGSTMQHLLA